MRSAREAEPPSGRVEGPVAAEETAGLGSPLDIARASEADRPVGSGSSTSRRQWDRREGAAAVVKAQERLDRPGRGGALAGATRRDAEFRHTTHGFLHVRAGVTRQHSPRRGPSGSSSTAPTSDRPALLRRRAAEPSPRGDAPELAGKRVRYPGRWPDPERSGWSGDWQLSVPTASLPYDVAGS